MPTRRVVIVSIVYLFLVSLTQSLLSHFIHKPHLIPDLLLMLPVLGGLWFGHRYGFWIGLSAGLFRDFLAGRLLGPGLLLGMYVGLAASLLGHEDRRFRLLFSALAVPVATLLHTGVMTLVSIAWPLAPATAPPASLVLSRAVSQLPSRIGVNFPAALFVLVLFYLIPLTKRRRRRSLGFESSGGVEHDVFDLS